MQKYKLKNGMTLLFQKRQGNSVAVEVMVKVGSNSETTNERGLSHFLEHMLFEGTKTRKTSREIANAIEKFGGEFNAYTTGDRTAYYVKIINKRFKEAVEILADMVQNPLFDEAIIKKEKSVILKEINMVTDDARHHLWVLFLGTVFDEHPAKYPTYGDKDAINAFSRKMIFDYYQKYYVPSNIIISVVGSAKNVTKTMESYFGKLKPKKVVLRKKTTEPLLIIKKNLFEERKSNNSYIALGYRTIPRLHEDSFVLDVIAAILGRGQSGWLFEEIRNKHGLAYQINAYAEHDTDYGYFAITSNLEKQNIEKAKSLIIEQFRKLEVVSEIEVREAKQYVEGNFALTLEDNYHAADSLSYWETMGDALLAKDYFKKIAKVSKGDVQRAAKKYLTNNYAFVTIGKE